MWHHKTTTVLVLIRSLVMIKKETYEHINMILGSPSSYEKQTKKLHFAELLIPQCAHVRGKVTPKVVAKLYIYIYI